MVRSEMKMKPGHGQGALLYARKVARNVVCTLVVSAKKI